MLRLRTTTWKSTGECNCDAYANPKEKKESGADAKCDAYVGCTVNTGTNAKEKNKESGADAKCDAYVRCTVNTGTNAKAYGRGCQPGPQAAAPRQRLAVQLQPLPRLGGEAGAGGEWNLRLGGANHAEVWEATQSSGTLVAVTV